MSKSLKQKTKECSIICAVLSLIMLVFQFVPFWQYTADEAVMQQKKIETVETRDGEWMHIKNSFASDADSEEKGKNEDKKSEDIDSAEKKETAKTESEAKTENNENNKDNKTAETAKNSETVEVIYKTQNNEWIHVKLPIENDTETTAGEEQKTEEKTATGEEQKTDKKEDKWINVKLPAQSLVQAEDEKVKQPQETVSMSGYIWFDFRDTALLDTLSQKCGEAVDFTSLLTPCILLFATSLLGFILSFAKKASAISALLPLLCGVVGVATFLFSSPFGAGFVWAWVTQLVVSIALCIAAGMKFTYAVRNYEREIMAEEIR